MAVTNGTVLAVCILTFVISIGVIVLGLLAIFLPGQRGMRGINGPIGPTGIGGGPTGAAGTQQGPRGPTGLKGPTGLIGGQSDAYSFQRVVSITNPAITKLTLESSTLYEFEVMPTSDVEIELASNVVDGDTFYIKNSTNSLVSIAPTVSPIILYIISSNNVRDPLGIAGGNMISLTAENSENVNGLSGMPSGIALMTQFF